MSNKLELIWYNKEINEPIEPRILIEDVNKSLLSDEKKSLLDDSYSDNILIHGDNLLGLKALMSKYSGKIKQIYIDPPYNTGSAFEKYDDNLEHSVWLTLMRDRLVLLRDLLKEDGSIWISIDADECHYLKVLCDEIFGRCNFVEEVIWQRSYAPINLKKTFSRNHDHILIYCKTKDLFNLYLLPRNNEADSRFTNPDNDPRGPWASGPIQVGPRNENRVYPITTPGGRVVMPPAQYCWRFSKEKYLELVNDNRIYFGPDGNNVPRVKRFLSEVKDGIVPLSLWLRDDVGDNQEAKKEIKDLFGKDVFDTPKPERLLRKILLLGSKEGDLVLDSFLGSGTTIAVAHKMKRRWIGIEMMDTVYTHCKKRIDLVINGLDLGGITKSVDWNGGGGYKFYELAPSLLRADTFGEMIINKSYNAEMLASAVALHEGFTFNPDSKIYWKQSKSSENSYLFVTTNIITISMIKEIESQMADDEYLLIACKSFEKEATNYSNKIKIKKIPQMLLGKCEFGHDDYSLNIINPPIYEDEED